MKYFYLLMLLVGVSSAAQPAPVYRSAPVLTPERINKPPVPAGSTVAPPQAEERESQAYPATAQQDPGKSNLGTTGSVSPLTGSVSAAPATKSAATGANEQVYKVYYIPGNQPTFNTAYTQPSEATYLTGYQSSNGVSQPGGYFSNINWMDVLAAASSLGLVGLGTAMLYPSLMSYKARAMRELAEINSDDAARMAKTVMKAIARFSEMNNARSD